MGQWLQVDVDMSDPDDHSNDRDTYDQDHEKDRRKGGIPPLVEPEAASVHTEAASTYRDGLCT